LQPLQWISKDAIEEFAGVELCTPDFESDRKSSPRAAMRAEIAGKCDDFVNNEPSGNVDGRPRRKHN
jgi:hypothetical protein